MVNIDGGIALRPFTSKFREGLDCFKRIFKPTPYPVGLQITRKWFTTGAKVTEGRGWPKPTLEYQNWVKRMASAKSYHWKTRGFYDMISLSATTITPCYDLLLHLLGFWSTKFNTFIFSWGVVTPTLLDVTAILGLPLGGKHVHAYAHPRKVNHDYVHAKGIDSIFIK